SLPASCSRRTPIICSFVNLIASVRPSQGRAVDCCGGRLALQHTFGGNRSGPDNFGDIGLLRCLVDAIPAAYPRSSGGRITSLTFGHPSNKKPAFLPPCLLKSRRGGQYFATTGLP